jgi:hypothetical protein
VPFTVSHIAAVIPGYRWFSRAHVFSAAVIGSMVPDFAWLLPSDVGPARWETHSKLGLFTFCLPVGLVAYFLTQWLIRPAVTEVLPDRAFARLQRAQPSASLTQIPSWLMVVGALLLGAVTHLIWDELTHENAHSERAISILGYYVPDFFGHPAQLYPWLQLGSSVLGLVVVAIALVLWLLHVERPIEPVNRRLSVRERNLWLTLYCAPPLLMIAWTLWTVWTWHMLSAAWLVGALAVQSLRGIALSLMGISVLLRLRIAGQ